ncbi:MAG: alkaline phosphatase family protein [Candidatus Eisenbacteria bacterium]|nr:alkaline phosphatase family protein [Candidatus Eisenbacteria bacterium]
MRRGPVSKRLCIIGLDCLTPQFLFGPWLAEMPHLRGLMDGGIHGNLVSTIPPITVPAWMAMMTSQDPGMLGIYGFRNRASHGYEDTFTVNATHVKAKTVWNHLSRNRLRSIVMGVPLTYPPRPLRGVMVCDFLTPGKDVVWTSPPELASRLDDWAGGEYIIDVRDFRNERKRETLDQIYRMTNARFQAFRRLLSLEDWDFAMMVEMGPDRLHHAFWRYADPAHRLYRPGNEFEDVIHRYYVHLDGQVGRVLQELPKDVSVIVVSDHGAQAMHGAVCINEWLIARGLLTLKRYPEGPTRLKADMIDWSRTRVWSEGGYYARIFLNVEGREPDGRIPAGELAAFKRDLKSELENLTDEAGRNIGTRVFLPEEVYRASNGTPPDMIVYLGNLDWRSAGMVGGRQIHVFENDTGPDDANHSQEGIFIWQGRGKPAAGAADRVSIYDVAPSILDYFGIATPGEMIGKVL